MTFGRCGTTVTGVTRDGATRVPPSISYHRLKPWQATWTRLGGAAVGQLQAAQPRQAAEPGGQLAAQSPRDRLNPQPHEAAAVRGISCLAQCDDSGSSQMASCSMSTAQRIGK
jgi:hypothetical protein